MASSWPSLHFGLRLALILFANFPRLKSSPLPTVYDAQDALGPQLSTPDLWFNMSVAVVLVLVGGVFAGLTIALMGQDTVNLKVISTSGDVVERAQATTVLRLLERGKHWVLVTLLLGNVVVNEALPIVLDQTLGGGWLAVVGSTVLIVIFGEIIPQSVCVRFGLAIGASLSPLVLILMYLFSPVAWPTAKLLDYLLGEDQGTLYKKDGLKTLITLHKSFGPKQTERLNQDEVTIIQAVLDLKAKSVSSIMTPMKHVFTLSRDDVLDQKLMDHVLSAGFSRIPVHEPGNDFDFVGMLLVKTLITYDPEDAMKVSEFTLAALPETRPETSCLDILNYFQEGQSHMVLVSDDPVGNQSALGVVTLEDVIEELIGEEIIDESDVYVDINKALKRPPPNLSPNVAGINGPTYIQRATRMNRTSVTNGLKLRRAFSTSGGSLRDQLGQQLAPSNPANNPKQTKYGNVKLKQNLHGAAETPTSGVGATPSSLPTTAPVRERLIERPDSALTRSQVTENDERTPLLK